jgi:hypothetical protein
LIKYYTDAANQAELLLSEQGNEIEESLSRSISIIEDDDYGEEDDDDDDGFDVSEIESSKGRTIH